MKKPFSKAPSSHDDHILPPSSYGEWGLDDTTEPSPTFQSPSWSLPSDRPKRTVSSPRDSSRPASSYGNGVTDIWGDPVDDWRNAIGEITHDETTLMDRIREHKKPVAAGLAAAAVIPVAMLAFASTRGSSEDAGKASKPPASTTTTTPDYEDGNWVPITEEDEPTSTTTTEAVVSPEGYTDLDRDGKVSEFEKTTQKELEQVPSPEQLPPVLSQPFRPLAVEEREAMGEELEDWEDQKGEVSGLVDEYEPKFVGAYESITGMKLNIYAATQPGEEGTLKQEFKINRESIEYILLFIKEHIEDTPDSATKDAIIQNFKDTASGKDDRLYQIVFDVSPETGCIDADDQLRRFTEEICGSLATVGLTIQMPALDGDNDVNIPILVSTGTEYVATKNGKTSPPVTQAEMDAMSDEELTAFYQSYGRDFEAVPSKEQQMGILAHELGHGISGTEDSDGTDPGYQNTYRDGDNEHMTIGGYMGGEELDGYDLTQAEIDASPRLAEKIKLLVNSGLLKPIIEKA